MKVLYDHQIFISQKFGGISRYFVELINSLPKSVLPILTVFGAKNYYVKHNLSHQVKGIRFFYNGNIKVVSLICSLLNRIYYIFLLSLKRDDVIFHPTYYSSYYLRKLKLPYVITVYDMIHELFYMEGAESTLVRKKKTICGANKIIAISESTKRDLIRLYGIESSRIDVIYLSHSLDRFEPEVVLGLPSKYVLFVGAREWYKNFYRFVQAVRIVRNRYPHICLICTGTPFTNEEKKLLKENNLWDDTQVLFASEKQLFYLYQNAEAFVFPSEYEGFGIPILEAFFCGCPVALSNRSSFPEVAGDAGAYFDPTDPQEMAEVLIKILENRDYRNTLIQKGFEQEKKFSWKEIANQTVSVYYSAAKGVKGLNYNKLC